VSVVVFALTKVSLVVIPLLIALILATAIAPVVRWFASKGVPALWATMLSFLSILTVVGGLIAGIVFAIKGEWDELVKHSSESFTQLWDFVKNGPLPVDDSMIADAQKWGTDFLTSSNFGSGALTGVGVAGNFLAGLGIVVVALFFFLKDGSQMWAFFLSFIPEDKKEKTILAGDKIISVLGGYVRGTATIAAVDAIIIWITLVILQVPLALPLAVLTFLGAFVPIVGATAANVLALMIALVFNGPVAAIVVLIVMVVSGQLEGNILQPILMGNALKIHGLTIILALTVGTILGGVVGAILSVPFVAAGWAVVKIWKDSESLEKIESETLEKAVEEDGDPLLSEVEPARP
jgi:predicted PurR-regulated permease PerM